MGLFKALVKAGKGDYKGADKEASQSKTVKFVNRKADEFAASNERARIHRAKVKEAYDTAREKGEIAEAARKGKERAKQSPFQAMGLGGMKAPKHNPNRGYGQDLFENALGMQSSPKSKKRKDTTNDLFGW